MQINKQFHIKPKGENVVHLFFPVPSVKKQQWMESLRDIPIIVYNDEKKYQTIKSKKTHFFLGTLLTWNDISKSTLFSTFFSFAVFVIICCSCFEKLWSCFLPFPFHLHFLSLREKERDINLSDAFYRLPTQFTSAVWDPQGMENEGITTKIKTAKQGMVFTMLKLSGIYAKKFNLMHGRR